MRRARVGGHEIAYRAWGDERAPAIVLLHGFVISHRYLVPLAEELAPRWRVLAPDMPGFGRSSKPKDALDIDALADAVAGWMEALHLPRAHVGGNSMGCQVAVALAQRHPTRVDRLGLVGPTVARTERTAREQAWRLVQDVFHERPSLPLLHVPDFVRCGPRRILQTARHALADAIEERAPHVDAPALVLRGEHDPLVSQRFAEELAAAFPDGRLVVIPESPHAGNYSAPAATARLLEAFLAEATRARPAVPARLASA